jgi:hypothetical protein
MIGKYGLANICRMEEAWDGKTSGAIGFALSFLVTFFD